MARFGRFDIDAKASLSGRGVPKLFSPNGSFRAVAQSAQPSPPSTAGWRARLAQRKTWLYFKREKLLGLLSSRSPKKILISGHPELMDSIRNGFGRLPHQIDQGPITEDSYQNYDIVVPISLTAIDKARHFSERGKCALPIPSADAVGLCNDKYEFNRALIDAGFGQFIPQMRAPGQRLAPPYLLKKSISSWGKDCYLILNHDHELAHLDRIDDPAFFCQEFIPGATEFATHILFARNRIVKALNIKYTFATQLPIKGQSTHVFRGVHRCQYLNLFAQILRTIQFEGLCCVNYKVANRQPYLLEINPRFGGSLAPFFFSFVRHIHS